MECPHLEQCASQAVLNAVKAKKPEQCQVCSANSSLWLCLTCGHVGCGRYLQKHGLIHYEQQLTQAKEGHLPHAVCMDCSQTAVFCYACDDFIVNDTASGFIERVRSLLTSSSDDESAVPEAVGHPPQETPRTLRPRRKRTQSSDSVGAENTRPSASKRARSSSETPKSFSGSVTNKRRASLMSSNGNAQNQNSSRKKKKNLVGLRNLGNTCFMSAVLQSLSNIQEFCRVLKQLPSLDQKQPSSSSGRRETRLNGANSIDGVIMTEELRKVLVALSQGEAQKAISPEALFHVIWKVVPRFRGYQQQDAHEFLRYMLDRLHTELLALLPSDLSFFEQNLSPYSRRRTLSSPAIRAMSPSSSHSFVTSIFGGMLQSEVTCLVCKTSSKKHDPFLDLSIDIPNSFATYRKTNSNASNGKDEVGGAAKPKCHLNDCLEKFTDVEELADSERFLCGRCNRKQPSTKKFSIRRLPNVLCLHIKRFRWSTYSRTKIDTPVEFPLRALDMSSYLLDNLHETRCSNAGSSLYDLAAVIVHHGSGAGSGHYTAFVTKNNSWYHFNDSTVSETDTETVAKSKAYILFYIQRELKLPSAS